MRTVTIDRTFSITIDVQGETQSASAAAVFPAPTVTSVYPPMQFSFAAGEPLIVRGSGFRSGATVLIDDVPCTANVVHNSVKIFCNAPAIASEGAKVVRVVNNDGRSGTLAGGYRGFSSTSIMLWLDPAYSGNDTTTVAGRYKTIVDRSGNSRHYTQTDNAKLPQVDQIGGIPSGKYSGNLHLRGPGFPTPSAAEAFAVVKKPTNAGGLQPLWRTGSGTNGTGFYPTGDFRILDEFGSTSRKDIGVVSAFDFSLAHVYNVTSKAASWTVRLNNVQKYTTGTNTVGFFASSAVLGGGADASTGNPIDYAFTGNIGEVVYFARECTTEERAAIQAFWAVKYFGAWPHTLVLCDGDSITAGTLIAGTGPTYPQALQTLLGSGYVVINQGLDGDTIANMVAVASTQVDPFLATYAALPNSIIVPWAGTNDFAYGQLTSAGAITKHIQYNVERRVAGWDKVIEVSMLPRSAILTGTNQATFDLNRAAFNAAIQASPFGADALADPASNAIMGPNGAELNTTYYVDKVHPTNAGAAINAGLVYAAIQSTIPDV